MTRQEAIVRITHVRDWLRDQNYPGMASDLTAVLDGFEGMERTAASILGSKGGNSPVKPGSRPRGRPKKSAISEEAKKEVD